MKKRLRARLLVRIYAIAGVLTLGLYAAVCTAYLDRWRQTALYGSSLAFEETVRAVESLSLALDRSLYATDAAMGASLCGDAYAGACAAESAMSTLPFATQELEQLAGFLNRAGDYARSLCAAGGEIDPAQRETLAALSAQAGELLQALREDREGLNGGVLRMDSREKRLRNVGTDPGTPLSTRLLELEADFAAPEGLRYDGRYGKEASAEIGYLTEEEMLRAAAAFLGVEASELTPAYAYEGQGGRRCYRWRDSYLCVSRSGVESLSQSRLVSEAALEESEALERAEAVLRRQGYGDLRLLTQETQGAVSAMRFARLEDGALWYDNCLSIAIALDDGSVYSFHTADYSSAPSGAVWTLDETAAAAALPEGFERSAARRVILTSEGGKNCGCYEFEGEGLRGETVRIDVDAVTGRQRRISVSA